VRLVLPPSPPRAGQSEKRFVDEGRDLEGVIAPLATHVSAGEPSQLRLHDGQRTLEGALISVAPGSEEFRDRSW